MRVNIKVGIGNMRNDFEKEKKYITLTPLTARGPREYVLKVILILMTIKINR